MKFLKFDMYKSAGLTKPQYETLLQIAKRAKKCGAWGDIMTIAMDIQAGIQAYEIDIDKLAGFDNYNLMHDIHGLQARIRRDKGHFIDDCFLPRSVVF